MTERYTVGVDFGTESGRAVLVDCEDGRELAAAVYPYRNAVIDAHLPAPDDDVLLEPDWALQDPDDYVRTLEEAVPQLLRDTGVDPAHVIGVGVDFTACTMLPATADGTPLCRLDAFRRQPHAWVKLWKHHAAQPEADRINEVASQLGESWLPRYGDRISSEWFFAKALQILDEAPDVYEAADRLIEAADWIVWQLTGVETRNSCTAGYKAMWSKRDGFPSRDYFAALDVRFADVVDEKMSRRISPLGARAGSLTDQFAARTGLRAGTAVAVANVDAHVSAPAASVTAPGTMVVIMGTSNCHILLGREPAVVEGMCGVVEDGVVPGLHGFEAGQSAVGDIFAWFAEHCVPARYRRDAQGADGDVHRLLEEEAAALRPGESGLLALDWWNGNRSVLVDADLSGLLLGMSLSTSPPEIYRALIEATVFGTRVIIDAFEAGGVPVEHIVACGGLPQRNRLLMQIYADVTGRTWSVAASEQAPALGSAMFAAVAARSRARRLRVDRRSGRADGIPVGRDVRTDPACPDRLEVVYGQYVQLHDLFGRGGSDAMKTLRRIREQVRTERLGPEAGP
jgi:L-ribulokinase